MFKKYVFQWLLICLLVIAQAGMFTHEISHYAKHLPIADADISQYPSASTERGFTHASIYHGQSTALDAFISLLWSTKFTQAAEHIEDTPSPEDQRHLVEVCLQCLSFAQMGVVLLAVLLTLIGFSQQATLKRNCSAPKHAELITTRYLARAPPLFI